jgi:cellulose biosynthesis protein BcsQ
MKGPAMENERMHRTILVAMLKGGVRKTTTTMFLAFEMAQRGERVLIIDADRVTQGVTDWATRLIRSGEDLPGGIDIVKPLPTDLLAAAIKGQIRRFAEMGHEITRVLVDVGGEQPDTVREAAILADLVILPVGSEQAELGRLDATLSLLDIAGSRGPRAHYAVLLNKVAKPGQGVARAARELVEGSGHPVFATEIPLNGGLYASPWGTVPATTGAYAALADEVTAALTPASVRL